VLRGPSVLYLSIHQFFTFLDEKCELNDVKHFLNLICTKFTYQRNAVFLLSLPGIVILIHKKKSSISIAHYNFSSMYNNATYRKCHAIKFRLNLI